MPCVQCAVLRLASAICLGRGLDQGFSRFQSRVSLRCSFPDPESDALHPLPKSKPFVKVLGLGESPEDVTFTGSHGVYGPSEAEHLCGAGTTGFGRFSFGEFLLAALALMRWLLAFPRLERVYSACQADNNNFNTFWKAAPPPSREFRSREFSRD